MREETRRLFEAAVAFHEEEKDAPLTILVEYTRMNTDVHVERVGLGGEPLLIFRAIEYIREKGLKTYLYMAHTVEDKVYVYLTTAMWTFYSPIVPFPHSEGESDERAGQYPQAPEGN